jgi:hypothetical protein
MSESGVYLYDNLTGMRVSTSLGLSLDGLRLDIVPDEALAMGGSYRYYANSLRDLSGNAFTNVSALFTTDFAVDEIAPQVLDVTVFEGQTGVPTNGRFNVRFNEPLSQLVTLGISLLDPDDAEVPITISFNSDRTIVTITPQQLLIANTGYTLTVNGMEDIAGNAQTEALAVMFTTGDTVDVVRGAITAWSFINAATDVAQNVQPSVTLSERIDTTGLNDTSFYLYDNTDRLNVPGTWAWDATILALRYIPSQLLEADHQYYLYVSWNARFYDLAGNQINNTNRYFFTISN